MVVFGAVVIDGDRPFVRAGEIAVENGQCRGRQQRPLFQILDACTGRRDKTGEREIERGDGNATKRAIAAPSCYLRVKASLDRRKNQWPANADCEELQEEVMSSSPARHAE